LEDLGTIIDRYKLLEKIGEGGFGVVYMAEQREPVRRMIALKIIKLRTPDIPPRIGGGFSANIMVFLGLPKSLN